MAQRITRAKRKIKDARIPYRVPDSEDLPERLSTVLAVIYLVFNEGYLPSSGASAIRVDLAEEAVRLGRVLRALLPEAPEVAGLLALMLLTDARRPSRFAGGELVPLDEQDRSRWDRTKIAEGHALVRECLERDAPGHYQLMAAINAVHADAPTAADTDWAQIDALYARLELVSPSPIVSLNRAVAIAQLDGPAVALAHIDRLELDGYHAAHATRADLLRRLGRAAEARAEYDAAIAAAGHPGERAFLSRRRDALAD